MNEKPSIKFNANELVAVTMKFDTGFEKEGDFGKYYQHTVTHNGEDTIMNVSPHLNSLIVPQYKRGDTINIKKLDTKPTTWSVHSNANGTNGTPEEQMAVNGVDYLSAKNGTSNVQEVKPKVDWDKINKEKTDDIHRQVAVKIVTKDVDFSKELEEKHYAILMRNTEIIMGLIENNKDIFLPF